MTGGRARRLAAAAALLAASSACHLPYPVPAGSVEDRTPRGPAATDPSWPGTGCPATLRQEVLERVNAIRGEHGLVALRPHAELVAAAQGHTVDQSSRDRVTHRGADGSASAGRAEAAGYAFAGVGENVAGGYDTPASVVEAWMDSPGHRAIILSPEPRHAGVGYDFRVDGRLHHFWTLVVGEPGAAESTPPLDCHP